MFCISYVKGDCCVSNTLYSGRCVQFHVKNTAYTYLSSIDCELQECSYLCVFDHV